MSASSTIVNTVVRSTMWMKGGHYALEEVATHLPELSEGHWLLEDLPATSPARPGVQALEGLHGQHNEPGRCKVHRIHQDRAVTMQSRGVKGSYRV